MVTPYAYPGLAYPAQVHPSENFPVVAPSTGSDDSTYAVSYRFEVLDRDENFLRECHCTETGGGELKWFSTKSIKGGGTLNVRDTGQYFDWPNSRIKPVRVHTSGSGVQTEYPLGVYLMSAPVEEWDALGRKWAIELLDKCSILDSDIVTDEDGNPISFGVVAGTNVIDTVVSLIESTGESASAIEGGSVPLGNDMTWETGTTVLRIINDLLAASNYFSIWCDMEGQFRTTPYQPPEERPVVYADGTAFGWDTPFSYGPSSLMAPEWTRDLDIYAIPNRWVAISQGDGEREGMVAVATNEDPASPFSYPSRGRWITQVEHGVEAVDEGALQARARRSLENATSTTVGVTASHLYLPDVQINSVVHFRNELADGLDSRMSVLNTTVPFDPLALCKTEFREFGGSHTTWEVHLDDS